MTLLALLATALLFGGMVLYSFGFAAFLFSSLPAMQAGPLLRRAFPHFYLFVLVASVVAALCLLPDDMTGAALMGLVAATVIPTRQVLMPAINLATDTGRTRRFKALHTLSVGITLGHIGIAAWVLSRFI
ncbi:DUF4149 domain-containing protein [Aliiruegeria lutimaris]|uniref:TMEM205-like domain-containing protein n=1 Tax=Aliiruegeria lutimaris TaxID=571298 RepID=A0A1G9KMZ5_9RHOB|nr:DUF4149 domain-containing protein [Aliiruegeria lutimaris]SDL50874.1 protein of unknown function [Aliiruegeria lutimaris]